MAPFPPGAQRRFTEYKILEEEAQLKFKMSQDITKL